jgi:pSer/pThr/pTyr-binding forkhead associated (FHA) protein
VLVTKRKTVVQSTDEVASDPRKTSAVEPEDGDDFELTMKENPGLAMPSARPNPRQTVAASPSESRQTIAAPLQTGARQTIQDMPASARQTLVEKQGVTEAIPYRSVNRPPMGLITAFDDGSNDSGEEYRIRVPRFIIGRTAGDAVFPHDIDMSGEHAEISCNEKDGGYEWQLRDLKSTNGTFLRAQRFVLRNGKEILLGGRRYMFRQPGVVQESPTDQPGENARVTQPYQPPPSDVAKQLTPRLVELTADGDGRQFLLNEQSSLFGSDPVHCRHVVSGDPFLDPQHARLFQDDRGRWVVEDRQSMNGLWVRVERITLDRASEFQLGGQRFRFRIP